MTGRHIMNKIASKLVLTGIALLSTLSCDLASVYKPIVFEASLSGVEQVPANKSRGKGSATLVLDGNESTASLTVKIDDLAGTSVSSYLHTPSRPGSNSIPVMQLSGETIKINIKPEEAKDLKAGLVYINVTSTKYESGELRGQFFEKL